MLNLSKAQKLQAVHSWYGQAVHSPYLLIVKWNSLSRVQLFVTPWTIARQAPLSMEFSRQGYWSGLSFPSPGDLPDPGIKPESPALQADFLKHTNEGIQGKLAYIHGIWCIWYMHWLLKIKDGISVGQESISWHGINWHMTSVLRDSLVAQMVKNLLAIRETWVRSLGPKDPLEKEMATHSSILAWKILWTEEPGRVQSIGSQRVGHNWATTLSWWCLTWLPQL